VAFADALNIVFLSAVPFAILAFILTLRLKEEPLRTAVDTEGDGDVETGTHGDRYDLPEPEGVEIGESLGMEPPVESDGYNGSHVVRTGSPTTDH
jgi:hypothetical protein